MVFDDPVGTNITWLLKQFMLHLSQIIGTSTQKRGEQCQIHCAEIQRWYSFNKHLRASVKEKKRCCYMGRIVYDRTVATDIAPTSPTVASTGYQSHFTHAPQNV